MHQGILNLQLNHMLCFPLKTDRISGRRAHCDRKSVSWLPGSTDNWVFYKEQILCMVYGCWYARNRTTIYIYFTIYKVKKKNRKLYTDNNRTMFFCDQLLWLKYPKCTYKNIVSTGGLCQFYSYNLYTYLWRG